MREGAKPSDRISSRTGPFPVPPSAAGQGSGMQIAALRGMEKRIAAWIERYRYMDWAVLYMRLFAGAMMLFHNIGKIQDYNEIIGSYPAVPPLGAAATFVVVTIAEVVLAVLIILGIRVRMAALLMTLGIVLAMAWSEFATAEADFIWLGMYVFLVVSGGGLYGFDAFLSLRNQKNRPSGQ